LNLCNAQFKQPLKKTTEMLVGEFTLNRLLQRFTPYTIHCSEIVLSAGSH